jgi:NTE family protein
MRQMRAIAFVTKLIDDGKILDNSMKRMLIHDTDAADVMIELGSLDKLNPNWDNLSYLMNVGRARADTWLQKNFSRLGEESTVDIRDEYL